MLSSSVILIIPELDDSGWFFFFLEPFEWKCSLFQSQPGHRGLVWAALPFFFLLLLLSLYVSSQRYCSVWGWSSLPEGGQAIGATACLRKEKLQLDIPVSISHFQTKLLIPDWLTTAENQLFLCFLTTKFTIASTSSVCTASAPD